MNPVLEVEALNQLAQAAGQGAVSQDPQRPAESHIRNAMARWNQTNFESRAAGDRARKKILRAAERFGIEVSDEDKVVTGKR